MINRRTLRALLLVLIAVFAIAFIQYSPKAPALLDAKYSEISSKAEDLISDDKPIIKEPAQDERHTSIMTFSQEEKMESLETTSIGTDDGHILNEPFQKQIESIKRFFELHKLGSFESLREYKDGKSAPSKGFDDKMPILTKEELQEFLIVPDDTKLTLTNAHQAVVNDLPSKAIEGAYRGTGVVYVSGGKYLPTMLVSLRMLRRVSPVVPVEVIIGTRDEYEPEMCEKVLPSLGAHCVIIEDIFGREFLDSFNIRGYQYKALGILASSFDNVIFVDSDNMPVANVEQVIEQEPFLSRKYILWPDFWFRTTSPHFYDIVGLEIGDRVRGNLSESEKTKIPLHDRQNAIPDKSSESGQLVVSKNAHLRGLMLATYYNLIGYDAYYPLLTQGSAGEGDKETFIAAALVLGEPVYQLHQSGRPTGRFKPEYEMGGILQSLPIDDYHVHETKTRENKPRILFVHFNMFKLNLRQLLHDRGDKFTGKDEDRIRMMGKPSDNYETFDYKDPELSMWQDIEWISCVMPRQFGVIPNDWKESNMTELCMQAEQQTKWLTRTHLT